MQLSNKQIHRIAKSLKSQIEDDEEVMSTGYTTKITEIPPSEEIYDPTYVFEITLTDSDITLYFKYPTYEEASELGKVISNHIGFKVG